MDRDILRSQTQEQTSSGKLGGVINLIGKLRPKNKPTSPDALVKRGMNNQLGKSPLTGQPMVVGDLYGFPRTETQAIPSGEVPAEALVVVKALEGGSTIDTLVTDTEMSPTQVNVGLSYLKDKGVDLDIYR